MISVYLIGCTSEVNTVKLDTQELTLEEKLEDFEYMYQIIEENYPFFNVNKRLHNIDWVDNKEQYRPLIEQTKDNDDFMRKMTYIVSQLNNGHTHVLQKQEFGWYYSVYAGSEDTYAIHNPWAEVLKGKNTLKWYKFNETDIDGFKDRGYFGSNNPAFKTDIIAPNEIAYLKISMMNGARVEEDGKEIRTFYEEIKDYNKLIIDIRNNSGGSDRYWKKNVIEPLAKKEISVENYIFTRGNYGKAFFDARGIEQNSISELDQSLLDRFPREVATDFERYFLSKKTLEPVNSINFDGKIYLLVDKKVYSSSESFAVFCKDSGFATLVGETTGGDGIGIDPLFFSLPNSGILVRFSSLLALNGDGTINEEVHTTPNVEIDATIELDYTKDKAIQYVIDDSI